MNVFSMQVVAESDHQDEYAAAQLLVTQIGEYIVCVVMDDETTQHYAVEPADAEDPAFFVHFREWLRRQS